MAIGQGFFSYALEGKRLTAVTFALRWGLLFLRAALFFERLAVEVVRVVMRPAE